MRVRSPSPAPRQVIGFFSAVAIVVASMIGTGIFTTTGILLKEVSAMGILLLWGLGGIVALCGALTYGELAATLPRSGGEYHFLGKIYHPLVGFLAGWISLTMGFSAPIAAGALAFGTYLAAVYPILSPLALSIGLVLVISLLHMLGVRTGCYFQNTFTILKVILIATFIGGGLFYLAQGNGAPTPAQPGTGKVGNPAFWVGLIFVSFAYSGWNGATYVLGEVKRPHRTIPLALMTGTLLVTGLYLGVNAIFLSVVPSQDIRGVVEVGHVVAQTIFGPSAGIVMSLFIALALVSSVSAMIMTGPRVYFTAGEDYPLLASLARLSPRGTPVIAIALQAGIALLLLITATFETLLNYIGFTLSLFTGLTVAGVFLLRRRKDLPRPAYRTWGYPFTPLAFILLSAWMVLHNVWSRPLTSLAGVITVGIGVGLYFLVKGASGIKPNTTP